MGFWELIWGRFGLFVAGSVVLWVLFAADFATLLIFSGVLR